jgi:hypothetical protein
MNQIYERHTLVNMKYVYKLYKKRFLGHSSSIHIQERVSRISPGIKAAAGVFEHGRHIKTFSIGTLATCSEREAVIEASAVDGTT